MKMKKSDFCVVGAIYAVCILFFTMTLKLKADAQTYPLFVLAILAVLNTAYLVKMLVQAKKEGTTSGFSEIFSGFQVKQFLVVVALIVAYLVMLYFIGFYPATIIFMLAALLFLRVPLWQTALATAVVVLLVYLAFTMFLHVRLPAGLLFK